MKRTLTLLLFWSFMYLPAFAATPPVPASDFYTPTHPPAGGLKNWWQKQTLKIKIGKASYVHKKAQQEEPTEKQLRKGRLSLILGISSFVAIFIPFVNLLALPAGILAIVFGAQSVKGNGNAKAIVGIVLGSITSLLFC